MDIFLKSSTLVFPEASNNSSDDIITVAKLETYVEEVGFLGLKDTPMWREDSLNLEEYGKKYQHNFPNSDNFTSFSSRVHQAHLPVEGGKLRLDLMEGELLGNKFPSLLAYISHGGYNSYENRMMHVEYFHEVFPGLGSGTKWVVRSARQVKYSPNWVIAEVSIVDNGPTSTSTSHQADFIKLPSGFIIEPTTSSNTCMVTIVEHWMIRKGLVDESFRASINGGARRVLESLQRYYLLPSIQGSVVSGKFRSIDYKKRVLNLSTQMVHFFCQGIIGVTRKTLRIVDAVGWIKDETNTDENVWIFNKERKWKSLVRSVTVGAPPSTVSSLVHRRTDIWEGIQRYKTGEQQIRMSRGQTNPSQSVEINNCVSVHQIKDQGFLMEETCLNPMMIIRAHLNDADYNKAVKDDKYIPIMLPYGFVLIPTDDGRCTVAVGYQYEAAGPTLDHEVKKILSSCLSCLEKLVQGV